MASSAFSGSLIRQVVDSVTLSLDPRHGLKEEDATIPQRFMQDESDMPRIEESWKRFCGTVQGLCKSRKRRSLFQHSNLRHAVFASGMANACQDFSRRTDNIKVRLIQHKLPEKRKILYSLKLIKLSEIPTETRSVRQFCVAEIPIGLPVAEGVFLGTATATSDSVAVATVVADDAMCMGSSLDYSRSDYVQQQHQQQQQQSQQQIQHNLYFVNPPVAMSALAVVEEDHDNDSNISNNDNRSARERMEELETIPVFLTEQEYVTKRQAILNSI